MGLLEQSITAFRQKQKQKDMARLQVQTLGQAVMEDEQPLDSPEALLANPTLAALLSGGANSAAPSGRESFDQLSTSLGPALQNLLSGLNPGGPTGLGSMLGQGIPQLGSALMGGQQMPAAPAAMPMAAPAPAPAAAPMGNDASSIAASLMGPQEQAAPEPVGGGFFDFLKDPGTMELLLQTSLGLARGEEFGQALTGGINAERAMGAADKEAAMSARDKKRNEGMQDRKFEVDLAKTIAETNNLNAASKKYAMELKGSADKPLTSDQYAKGYSDMYKHISSDIFVTTDIESGKEFLDKETLARYIWNSGVDPAERKYGPLKQEYNDEMAGKLAGVQDGTVSEADIASRIDEFVVAFGPDATTKMLQKLEGK